MKELSAVVIFKVITYFIKFFLADNNITKCDFKAAFSIGTTTCNVHYFKLL